MLGDDQDEGRSPSHEVLVVDQELYSDDFGIRPFISYRYSNNSCYIDTAQELWFRAFILWEPELRTSFLTIEAPKTAVLRSLFVNYTRRIRAIVVDEKAYPVEVPGQAISAEEASDEPHQGQGRARGRARGGGGGRGRG